ncbi:hypothetical protein Tco_0420689 [Tanacetum coccineum]
MLRGGERQLDGGGGGGAEARQGDTSELISYVSKGLKEDARKGVSVESRMSNLQTLAASGVELRTPVVVRYPELGERPK